MSSDKNSRMGGSMVQVLDNIMKSPDNQMKHCEHMFNYNPLGSQILSPTIITFPPFLTLLISHLAHQSPHMIHKYIASAIRSSWCSVGD